MEPTCASTANVTPLLRRLSRKRHASSSRQRVREDSSAVSSVEVPHAGQGREGGGSRTPRRSRVVCENRVRQRARDEPAPGDLGLPATRKVGSGLKEDVGELQPTIAELARELFGGITQRREDARRPQVGPALEQAEVHALEAQQGDEVQDTAAWGSKGKAKSGEGQLEIRCAIPCYPKSHRRERKERRENKATDARTADLYVSCLKSFSPCSLRSLAVRLVSHSHSAAAR